MEPLCIATTVKSADQLRWSLAVFAKTTLPQVESPASVKSVKGRLQHRLRPTHPDVFRRNFSLTAVGDASRDVVGDYVASQLRHAMRAIFCPSYYVGTIGTYDTGVIWNSVAASRGPTDAGSVETGEEGERGDRL